MSDRQAMTEFETVARRSVVALANSMLDGNLSFVEGAVQVAALKWQVGGIAADDADFNVFVGIASETDHLPLKQQRPLWLPEALECLAPEFQRMEEWARSFARLLVKI